ncbi:MAG: conjugal transfer protein TraF [Bermanella sp.]
MKKHLLVAAALLPALSQAAPVVTQPGPLMTLGPASTPQTGLSVLYNPASAETVIKEGDDYRWGYLGSTGFSIEMGDVDNFSDEVNDLIDDLDRDDIGLIEGNQIIDDYNNNLRQKLGTNGYIKFDAQFVAPLAPLLMRSDLLGGVVSLDLVGGITGKGIVLDDDIVVDAINSSLDTDTAFYLKSVQYTTLGLGYGHEMDNSLLDSLNQHVQGRLLVGARANMYNLKLSKQVIGLQNIDDGDELADVIADDLTNNQASSTQTGIDLGLIWEAENYHVGATWRNINEPEFDFGVVGLDCNAKSTTTSVNNCFTALHFINEGRISQNETHIMTSQTTVDAALNSANKRWRLAASYDLQAMRDPVGDEYQWTTVSAAYVSSSLFGMRVGLSENLAGTELTMMNAGMTLFGVLNLDVRYSLDTTEVDGTEVPRTFGLNIGLESSF